MQGQRGWMFLGVALLLGLAAAMMAKQWLSSQKPGAPQAMETIEVVVAQVDLPIATVLDTRQLRTVRWPKEHLPSGTLTDSAAARGRVLRRPLVAGEVLLDSALFEEGKDGGLAAVVSPDRRAVSVKVDPVIGLAGFVKPGARVDVVATLRRLDEKPPLPYSRVILQDILVLAVDQKLQEARDGEPELVNVVTLEVEPEQAQKLVYAAHEGKLQLAMRSPGDSNEVSVQSVNARDLVGAQRRAQQIVQKTTSVQVIRGSSSNTTTF